MRQLAYGEPLVLENVPEPEPGPGEVVVTVTRAAVNPLDVWVSRGTVAARRPAAADRRRRGRGRDGGRAAGRVPRRGLGVARDGSYAERVAVPAVALRRRAGRRSPTRRRPASASPACTALDIIELAGVEAGHDGARARARRAASAPTRCSSRARAARA